MENNDVQLIGGPCGQHGSYTFYKAFKYRKNGVTRIVTISEFFFVKLWTDSDLLCIGELQLLWMDKNSDQVLSSLRLYFLPENTPEGRMDHGEDEVLAISEKVVIRLEDLITWITVDAEWTWGRVARCYNARKKPELEEKQRPGRPVEKYIHLQETSLDFSDIEKEKSVLEADPLAHCCGPSVVILSYPRYCRFRAMMRRLDNLEDEYLRKKTVQAMGGFATVAPTVRDTRVLFCRDTFDYPELEGHELLCNHLAPKLKGRPRGRRKKRSVSPNSESNESESSVSNAGVLSSPSKSKSSSSSTLLNSEPSTSSGRRSTRLTESLNNESKEFMRRLHSFMKSNHTPIGRIPSLGYKEIDLFGFFTKVQKLGGYTTVTRHRLWKSIFDDMNGHHNCTSAATVIRRHYERLLLPYEHHLKGETYKPLPASERRRLKNKSSSSISDNEEISENTSGSDNSMPVNQTILSNPDPANDSGLLAENKENNLGVKPGAKTSSLRSIRVKPDRQKEKSANVLQNNIVKESDSKNLEVLVLVPVPVQHDQDRMSEKKEGDDCPLYSRNEPDSPVKIEETEVDANTDFSAADNKIEETGDSPSPSPVKEELPEPEPEVVEAKPEIAMKHEIITMIKADFAEMIKPEIVAIKPELAMKAEIIAMKPEVITMKPDIEAPIKSEHVAIKPEIISMKPEILAMEPEPIAIKPEIIPKPDRIESVSRRKDTIPCKNETSVKPEIVPVKPEMIPKKIEIVPKIENIPDKNAEPLTSAVAPVAQKIGPETLSPVEGKENIPIIKTGDTASVNDKRSENSDVPVPYNSKSPEEDDVNSEAYKSVTNTNTLITHQDYKKRKLDILKEGGLEVTPVNKFSLKDRPSVIHTQLTAKLNKADIQSMPPPSVNTVPIKKTHLTVPQNFNQATSLVKNNYCKPVGKSYNASSINGHFPPKVVQSKSIYTYSEKTVYGNPREALMPVHPPTTRFNDPSYRNQGDILDLTIGSQKPIVEIMRVPNVPVSAHTGGGNYQAVRNSYKTQSVIDGRRLGSNLEITLVGSHSRPSVSVPVAPNQAPVSGSSSIKSSQSSNKSSSSHKRSLDYYANSHCKVPRFDENGIGVGKYKQPTPPAVPVSLPVPVPQSSTIRDKSNIEITIPRVTSKPDSLSKQPSSMYNASLKQPVPSQVQSSYLSQLYEGNKNMNPYLPFIDPSLYYSALQNLYTHNNVATPAVNPVLPFLSPEQLKFYSDLMAHNARLSSFPFPDGSPSLLNSNNNNYKKQ